MIGLSRAWRWISVSMTSGSASVKKPAPPSPLFTGGSWPGSPSTSTLVPKESRSRPSFSSTIEHSSTTTSARLPDLARAVDGEGRLQLARLLLRLLAARAVDQRMERAGVGAAAVAHDLRGLAGEGGEEHVAVGVVGDVPRQHRLAGAGVAEEAKDLLARGFQPAPRRREAQRPVGEISCARSARRSCSNLQRRPSIGSSPPPRTLTKRTRSVPDRRFRWRMVKVGSNGAPARGPSRRLPD